MSFIADIANRWTVNHPTPCFVGAAPEGTLLPYVVFMVRDTRQERSAKNTVNWNVSITGFTAVASTSVEADSLADYAESLFNLQSFASVADMALVYRTTFYTDSPTLTSNRAWVTTIDFSIKH